MGSVVIYLCLIKDVAHRLCVKELCDDGKKISFVDLCIFLLLDPDLSLSRSFSHWEMRRVSFQYIKKTHTSEM